MRLITAKLRTAPDSDASFEYLGVFTNKQPAPQEFECGRAFEHRPGDPFTLNYFISAEVDSALDLEIRKLRYRENYERMLEYENSGWYPMEVWLEITLEIGGTAQVLQSPGEHDVASDCPECLADIAEQQLDLLAPALKELHFSIKDVLELGLEI